MIAALNAQHALERRYARREDISLIVWERIEAVPPKGGGVSITYAIDRWD